MADENTPIIGNASAFERNAKAILARAEEALRQSVRTLAQVEAFAGQISAAGSASAGEDRAAQAINRKADAAERAASAVARQNVEMRSAGGDAVVQERAAAATERRAAATARLAASTVAIREAEARGQSALFDEAAGRQARIGGSFAPGTGQPTLGFATPPQQRPLAEVYEEEAAAERLAAEAMRAHVAALEEEAVQLRLAASQVSATHQHQASLLDEQAGHQARLFAPMLGVPLSEGYEQEAIAQRDAAAATREHLVALEREAAALRLAGSAAPGVHREQLGLLDEARGSQTRLFAPQRGEPLAVAADRDAQALARVNAEARATTEAEARLTAMSTEAAAAQTRVAAAQREAARSSLLARGGLGGMTRGYAEFLAVTAGVGFGLGLFHDIVDGAKQAQQGVQDLKRVLEHVDATKAVAGFRQLSQEFNVPIETVAQTQFGFARVTQDQNQALEATRAGLAATKLDAIGAGDSVRYLTVAMQAFHLTGTQLSAQGGVFDQLENVSRRLGVPVGQIMQSFRALPAVANTGGDLTQFIGISAAMARASGRTGTEINTTIARAATNFVPRNAAELRTRGLDPSGSITQLIIDATAKAQHLNRSQRTDLANLIAGPLRGGTLLGLFDRPDVLAKSLHEAAPGTAAGATAQEMRQVMGRIDTQIGEVGKHLAGLGTALAQSGVLNGLGLFARTLTSIIDKLRAVIELFNAIPAHNVLAPVLEFGGAVALARRAGVGERLGGPLSFLAGPLTSPLRPGREALNAERAANREALARTRTQVDSAAGDIRLAAGTGNAEAAVTARARLAELTKQESFLAGEQAALASRTAKEQLAVNAARERELAAMAVGSGIVGAEGAAAGATAEAKMLGGSKGLLAEGGLLSMAGGAGKFLKGAGALGVYFAAFEQLQGMVETHGNIAERIAGGGRSVLGMVGIHTGPITNEENRAAGAKDAEHYVRGLQGGLAFNARDEAEMNRRRMDLTKKIGALDEQDGGNKYRVDAQMRALEAELNRETALEQAAASLRRGRKLDSSTLLALNSKELEGMQAQALLPMTTVGDDRGLHLGVAVAEVLAAQGHRQNRPDLLKKADDAIKANVQAITSELQDNLGLANSQRDRDSAYAKAIDEANKLIASHSPAQRRAGELLKRQTVVSQLQDDATARETQTGIRNALDPGNQVGAAQRAAEAARRNYQETRQKLGKGAPETRKAYQQYQEARNAANDAALQQIEQDTTSAQAGQRTQAGKDTALVAGLEREVAKAKSAPHPNTQKITDLENQLADAKQALAQQQLQDANARIDAHYQYLEATTDDPVKQALDEYQRALAQHVDPTDPNGPANKRAQVAQAAQRYRQAQHQQALDNIQAQQAFADAITDPGDAVAIAKHAETAAKKTLAAGGFTTDAQRKTAEANVRKTHADTLRARQQAAFDDIQHNAAVGKLTTDMEVAALRRMLSTVHHNKALRRQIEEQIYSLTHQDQGGLELQLGNIRLPSPYEVNRAIREGGGSRASARGLGVHNTVNVTVTGDADIGKMANAIDNMMGTSTRSALRAAGAL